MQDASGMGESTAQTQDESKQLPIAVKAVSPQRREIKKPHS